MCLQKTQFVLDSPCMEFGIRLVFVLICILWRSTLNKINNYLTSNSNCIFNVGVLIIKNIPGTSLYLKNWKILKLVLDNEMLKYLENHVPPHRTRSHTSVLIQLQISHKEHPHTDQMLPYSTLSTNNNKHFIRTKDRYLNLKKAHVAHFASAVIRICFAVVIFRQNMIFGLVHVSARHTNIYKTKSIVSFKWIKQCLIRMSRDVWAFDTRYLCDATQAWCVHNLFINIFVTARCLLAVSVCV